MAQPHYKLKYTAILLTFLYKKLISSKRADLMTFTRLFFPQWQVMTMRHDVKPCVVLIILLDSGNVPYFHYCAAQTHFPLMS